MKLLLLALVVAPVLSLSSSEFLTEFGDKHDAGSVMAHLQGMMGAAQQKLGLAERHHKKTVKKIRTEAEKLLQDESNVYGNYFNNYGVELTKATAELEQAVDAAKAGLAKAEAAPSNPGDWKDPNVEVRAKLGAQVAAAERTIKRGERRRSRSMREAEERGEESMEDESQKLGLKLGDMTPLVDKAKTTLEAVAEKTPVLAAGEKATKSKDTSSKKVDFDALTKNLAKANKESLAATTDANKKLEGFLAKTEKDVATKAAKIQNDLEAAQKKEIEQASGKTQAKPAAKAKKAAVKPAAAVKKAVPAPAAVKPVAAVKKAEPVKAAVKPVEAVKKAEPVKAVKAVAAVKK